MKIKSIKSITKEQTYDLSIEDNHNYFVSHSEVLVHNSGKDPSKVDRSAAYAGRYVAKNVVAAGLATKCLVQVSYAIGVARPTSIMVNTFGTGIISDEEITKVVENCFDLRPAGIVQTLDLLKPIYFDTAAYGHFGREDLNLPWEKLDKVEQLRQAAGIKLD